MERSTRRVWKENIKKIKDFDIDRLNTKLLEKMMPAAQNRLNKRLAQEIKEIEEDIFYELFYKCYNLKRDFKKGVKNE